MKLPPFARQLVGALLGGLAMILLMAWLAGAFRHRVAPAPPVELPRAGEAALVTVEAVRVPIVRTVTGAIGAEHETAVASQLLGRVVEVQASAGAHVSSGQVLVRLDDAEQQARLAAAEADLARARDDLGRTERQVASGTLPERELVRARTTLDGAAARVDEARTVLTYTLVRAPSDGIVIERECEVGDTVTPGRTLLRLFDRLQLVATVPESLRSHIAVGQELEVSVEAAGPGTCPGQVREIVPRADATSRAFLVKVGGPCPPGLIPGMFGRLRIPVGEREELRIPERAIRRVGQVPLVFRALPDGRLLRQFVRLGEAQDGLVVVTSGLAAGDRIVADAAALAGGER